MYILIPLCLCLAAVFLWQESKKNYVPAVLLKGAASACFVALGLLLSSGTPVAKLITTGLLLDCVADVLLNLRYVFEKKGQLIFLVGILVFLAGHVFYLVAIMKGAPKVWLCVAIGNLIASPSVFTALFSGGALLFLVSDIVLILNTFGKETKQCLRVTNISLYYVGQLLIALSLAFLK